MSAHPRGILKGSSGSVSKGRAIWDEGNLAMNDKIKQELCPTKIDEPKTPYHAPVNPDIGKLIYSCTLLCARPYSVLAAE
jgi:hypothetical protein